MKVLIAVHHFPPHYTGGAEWRAYRTAQALRSRGHTVQVLSIEHIDKGIFGEITWHDGIYDDLPVRRLSFDLAAAPDSFRWKYDNPWIGDHFRDLIEDSHPDLFHLIGGYLISAAPLRIAHEAGIPSVITLTDFWFLCPRIQMVRSNQQVCPLPIEAGTCARCLGEESRRYSIPGKYLSPLMTVFWKLRKRAIQRVANRTDTLKQVLNQADAIICPSKFLQDVFIQSGVNASQMIFARQGYAFPEDATHSLDRQSPSGQLRLGYLGQITPIKGIHILVEAVRQLPQIPLSIKIYGDASIFPQYSSQLQRQIARDRRITFEGTYQRINLSKVLNELDAIVVPSLWYENSPNVILEAFAHHTPVIATNLGGMAELITHEKNGLLFEIGNADDLASQIRRLNENPDLLAHLRQGIPPVKSMSEEIDELEMIYERVLKVRNP